MNGESGENPPTRMTVLSAERELAQCSGTVGELVRPPTHDARVTRPDVGLRDHDAQHVMDHDIPAGAESRRLRGGAARRRLYDAVHSPATSRSSLQLPNKLTLERWVSIGRDLASTTSSTAWWLGDWLIYGETVFTGRYRNAIEQTSLDYKTLRNYAWVARKFPQNRRHETLSFGHHAEVAGLVTPEQDFWLRKAETLVWSRNELRQSVRESLREREEAPMSENAGETSGAHDYALRPECVTFPPHEATNAPIEQLSVRLTHDQLETIRQAASSARLSIDTWATQILEEAARSAVSPAGKDPAGEDPADA
jgi:hypothetical protein